MHIAIIYDSKTGKTAKAAEVMGNIFRDNGHQCQVQSVAIADPKEVSEADLICIGGWVKGLFIILQHPSTEAMAFIDRMGDLAGKQVMIFCTYLLAAGSTLPQMANALEVKGANVVGQFKYRGSTPNNEFVRFAKSLN